MFNMTLPDVSILEIPTYGGAVVGPTIYVITHHWGLTAHNPQGEVLPPSKMSVPIIYDDEGLPAGFANEVTVFPIVANELVGGHA